MECRLQEYGFWIEKSFSILGGGGLDFRLGEFGFQIQKVFPTFWKGFAIWGKRGDNK